MFSQHYLFFLKAIKIFYKIIFTNYILNMSVQYIVCTHTMLTCRSTTFTCTYPVSQCHTMGYTLPLKQPSVGSPRLRKEQWTGRAMLPLWKPVSKQDTAFCTFIISCVFFPPQAFNDAYNLVEPTIKPGEVMSPYLIQNDTGLDLTIKLDNEFQVRELCSVGLSDLLVLCVVCCT